MCGTRTVLAHSKQYGYEVIWPVALYRYLGPRLVTFSNLVKFKLLPGRSCLPTWMDDASRRDLISESPCLVVLLFYCHLSRLGRSLLSLSFFPCFFFFFHRSLSPHPHFRLYTLTRLLFNSQQSHTAVR